MTSQKEFTDCAQKKCGLHRVGAGCPACVECGAPPMKINAKGKCVNCHCCERDEGFIRQGEEDRKTTIEIVIDQKEVRE